jgi:ectoine hydroxylase-related dioxygenase (phytanoyl-CoA dioxygenase family)
MATTTVTVQDIEVSADNLDVRRAAEIYQEHGCLVVRGLSRPYVGRMRQELEEIVAQSFSLLDQAEPFRNGWRTPDYTQFVAAQVAGGRDRAINSISFNCKVSATFLQCCLNLPTLDIMEAILGPDVELWAWGQCVYKEPESTNPKSMHQDGYYFEHKGEGPVAVLNYAVDTDLENGALHVVPGSHRLGAIEHVDDHWAGLALEDPAWWDRALPVCGQAGDAILFHALTVHGSKENRSPRPRPVFIHRYRRADDFATLDVVNMTDRRKAEENRKTRKTNEDWGLMVRGLRRYKPMPEEKDSNA